jgi:hypothetical protein
VADIGSSDGLGNNAISIDPTQSDWEYAERMLTTERSFGPVNYWFHGILVRSLLLGLTRTSEAFP